MFGALVLSVPWCDECAEQLMRAVARVNGICYTILQRCWTYQKVLKLGEVCGLVLHQYCLNQKWNPILMHLTCHRLSWLSEQLGADSWSVSVSTLRVRCVPTSITDMWRCLGDFKRLPLNKCVLCTLCDDFNNLYVGAIHELSSQWLYP